MKNLRDTLIQTPARGQDSENKSAWEAIDPLAGQTLKIGRRVRDSFDFETIEGDYNDSLIERIEKAYREKRGIDVSNIANLRPGINVDEKIIYLPDTVKNEDNISLAGIATLGNKLGFVIRLIPYGEKSTREISKDSWKLAAGISFAILDVKQRLHISRKSDPYEYGRTFARAQQVLGAVNAEPALSVDFLKKNHRFFGNNPNEMDGSGKSAVPVAYVGKTLTNIFREELWAKELSQLYLSLLKRSYELVDKEIMRAALIDSCISYSDAVNLYQSQDVVVQPSTGRRPAITKRKVPRMPRDSPLLLKGEMEFFNSLFRPLFTQNIPADTNGWFDFVLEKTWKDVRASLEGTSRNRAEFLTKFASLTTKRLQEFRKCGALKADSRKKDVTVESVAIGLANREDSYASLAREIQRFDPDFKGSLLAFRVETKIKGHGGALNIPESLGNIVAHAKVKSLYVAKVTEETGEKAPGPSSLSFETLNITTSTPEAVMKEINKITRDTTIDATLVAFLNAQHRLGYFLTVPDVDSALKMLRKTVESKGYQKATGDSQRRNLLEPTFKDWRRRQPPTSPAFIRE